MTKREIYSALINYATTGNMAFTVDGDEFPISNEELMTFAKNEIDLLDKRAARSRAATAKKQEANDALTEQILNVLMTTDYMTAFDLTAFFEDVSAAKIVRRLSRLAAQGLVEKIDMKIPATEDTKARTVKAFRRYPD